MWRWARGVGDWTSRWKVRREREREILYKRGRKIFLKNRERERETKEFFYGL